MSRWLSPREREMHRRRRLWFAAGLLALLLALIMADRPLFHFFYSPESAAVYARREWYYMFRSAGYYPTWVLISLAMLLHAARPWSPLAPASPPRSPRWIWWPSWLTWPRSFCGVRIALAAGIAGLTADLLKEVIGRLRPLQTDGFYRWRGPPDDALQAASFGLPSSHASVAFAAAFVLFFCFPWAGTVALFIAAGCALTRLLAGAHFASDIFVSVIIAYATAYILRPRRRPSGLDPAS